MRLVEQWTAIEQSLDPRWTDALVELETADDERRKRAAALLGPAGPLLRGTAIRFHVTRHGTAVGPEAARRLLRKLDAEDIEGTLELVSAGEAAPEPEVVAATRTRSAAAAWDAALAELPEDWSDLLCEVELTSSDHIEPAALQLAPINPIQAGAGRHVLRFRCAHSFGYGAAPVMVRRCLARLDEAGVPADVRVLRTLSDTRPVGTQGPVWYIGGRAT